MDIAIILSETRGGLKAVADQAGCNIIADSERDFDSITTFSSPVMTEAGIIMYGSGGWMALATRD